MIFTGFTAADISFLLPGLLLLFCSIILFITKRYKSAIWLLVLSVLVLRFFMAQLDPFLHEWDERYHAMVAKNFLLHPLKPTLYEEQILHIGELNWVKSHVWLHKPPLALWQMAFSFKLFGVGELQARLPDVLFGALLILIIFRMGTLMHSRKLGYLAALIFAVNPYQLEFATGGEVNDHIDFSFLFYITLSFWAWMEYEASGDKRKWALLTGLAVGLAVLTKFLPGMLVFAGWGMVILTDASIRKSRSAWTDIFIAAAVCLLTFVPWQVYTMIRFPVEAGFEMTYNRIHFFTPVEGHEGRFNYYFFEFARNYGWLASFFVLPGAWFVWKGSRRKTQALFLITVTLVCYLFFSLAATKMPAYCFVVAAPISLFLGMVALRFWDKMQIAGTGYKVAAVIILFAMVWYSMDLSAVELRHRGDPKLDVNRANLNRFTRFYKKLDKMIPDDYLIFNVPFEGQVEMMFYTGNTAYSILPSIDQYQRLKSEGRRMAVFQGKFSAPVPDYLQQDNEVRKLEFELYE